MSVKRVGEIKHFLLDMDGTIYLGDRLIDGAIPFLDEIGKQGKDFIFLTNNSSRNSAAYVDKLSNFGINVERNRVFTSGEATTIYLNRLKPGARVFLLGTKLLQEEFEEAGFILTDGVTGRPDFVVLGFDTTLTYDKLWKCCELVHAGVPYIATHADLNCPLDGGRFMPDVGAMIEFIKTSTGKSPVVMGKPSAHIVDAIVEKYGIDKNFTAIVGDRLYTDIKMGETAGITSILVLSGETDEAMYGKSATKADFVFGSVKDINEAIS